MADSDWANYKQLRGQELPTEITFRSHRYRFDRYFKRDFYAATGLYLKSSEGTSETVPEKIVLKVYHQDRLGILPLGWLGRWLADRERRYQARVAGLPNIIQVLDHWERTGMIREYIPGCHLREYRKSGQQPTVEFYHQLHAALRTIHERGFAHNDLSKAENILVHEDGFPVLIDFQIAHDFGSQNFLFGWLGRSILHYMQSVDRYHLRKHHIKDRPLDFTPTEIKNRKKKGLILRLHATCIRAPYRGFRHVVMRLFLKSKHALNSPLVH